MLQISRNNYKNQGFKGQKEIKEWFDMRQLIEDHFGHYNNIESSLFTPMKVEDDEIIDLSKIFKEKNTIYS